MTLNYYDLVSPLFYTIIGLIIVVGCYEFTTFLPKLYHRIIKVMDYTVSPYKTALDKLEQLNRVVGIVESMTKLDLEWKVRIRECNDAKKLLLDEMYREVYKIQENK